MTAIDTAPPVGAHTSPSPYALVPLGLIAANPWQPRKTYDDDHIIGLANDIEQSYPARRASLGLLQVPVGRVVDAQGRPVQLDQTTGPLLSVLSRSGCRVQLGFGHNRWKAFQVLADRDPRWDVMPLDLVAWSDEEMARAAWSENSARKDLNPLEEAQAIERYQNDFKWTQREVSEKLGIDRSTVAHKLRLLKLPDAQQQRVAAGDLSPRKAAALLPLIEAHPLTLKALAETGHLHWQPEAIFNEALRLNSDEIRGRVRQALSYATIQLRDEPWIDQVIDSKDVISPACSGCELLERVGATQTCLYRPCAELKRKLALAQRLARVEAATGVRAITKQQPGMHTFYSSDGAVTAAAQAAGCEHLRIYPAGWGAMVPDEKDLAYGCMKRGGCLCKRRAEAGAKKDDRAAEAAKAAEFDAAVLVPAADALLGLLERGDAGAWKIVVSQITAGREFEADTARPLRTVAQAVIWKSLSWSALRDKDRALTEIKAFFAKLGYDSQYDENAD